MPTSMWAQRPAPGSATLVSVSTVNSGTHAARHVGADDRTLRVGINARGVTA